MSWVALGVSVVVGVWVVVWTVVFRRALGARFDWRRRFEKMREMLGL